MVVADDVAAIEAIDIVSDIPCKYRKKKKTKIETHSGNEQNDQLFHFSYEWLECLSVW